MSNVNDIAVALDTLVEDYKTFNKNLTGLIEKYPNVGVEKAVVTNWQDCLGVLAGGANTTLSEVETVVSRLTLLRGALELEQGEANEKIDELATLVIDPLVMDGEAFLRLLGLGKVTELSGTIYQVDGKTAELRLNSVGAVRPPTRHISNDDELHVTHISLQMHGGSVLNKQGIEAVVGLVNDL